MAGSLISPRFKKDRDYFVTIWGGKTLGDGKERTPVNNYECAQCQFKSTSEQKMGEHLMRNVHAMRYPVRDHNGVYLGGKHPLFELVDPDPKPTEDEGGNQ